MTSALRSIDVESFRRDGWLVIPSALDKPQLGALDAAVGRLEQWAGNEGPGLHHFEQTDAGAVLARSEDFVPHDETLRAFVCRGLVVEVLAALFGEPAVLFKEKINYKYPGGGGFAPHQDASAYRFVDHHISCMVPLDPATPASGCLYVAPGFEAGQLPTDQRGRIEESTAAQLDWRPMPLEPGDLLFFDSYTPHYSDTNTTDRPRRAAYLTYNAASLGDHRRRYYDDKQEEFSRAGGDFAGERVRISISDDFLGRPVSGDTHALDPLDPLLAAYRSPIANQMYDETVTELEHALQTAALARAEGATPELIAASLLHDVGHLVVDDVTPNGVGPAGGPASRGRRRELLVAVVRSGGHQPGRAARRGKAVPVRGRRRLSVGAVAGLRSQSASPGWTHDPGRDRRVRARRPSPSGRSAAPMGRSCESSGTGGPRVRRVPGPAPLADDRTRSAVIRFGRAPERGTVLTR